ncbi:MAG: DUF4249 domain-containing protein, partial [Erysipelotrichaceae bacterium]|nr:DUF4249 domain-containing protein [Erysipelotrichaceae bacterium]
MIRKYMHLLSVILLLVSCSKYIDFSPPYEGDKIVINGYISPSEGAKIKITHSINPVGVYFRSDSLIVKDAVASLYENGIKLIDLKYLGKGFYGLPNSPVIELLAGRKYKLIVQSEQYGKAESEEITLPEQPEINDFKFGEIVEIYGQEHALFSFSIAEPSEKGSCFSIDAVTKNNESLYFTRYPLKDGEIFFESCEAFVGGYGGSMTVISNECGFTNQVHQYATRITYYDGQSVVNYKPLIIKIGTVSRDLYEYAKSYSDMAGLEFGFAEPPILKSNIIGGYGL